MTHRRRRALAASAPLLLAAAVAAPAQAAAVRGPDCYIFERYSAQNVPVAGVGFQPGEFVRIEFIDAAGVGKGFGSATADAAGSFRMNANPATYARFDTQDQSYTLRATGTRSGAVATSPYRQVRPFTLTPSRVSDVRKKIRYTVRGMPRGRTIYAHFRYNGRTLGNVGLGRAVGPCGIATRRITAVPKIRRGVWRLQFDASKRYSSTTRPRVTGSLTVGSIF